MKKSSAVPGFTLLSLRKTLSVVVSGSKSTHANRLESPSVAHQVVRGCDKRGLAAIRHVVAVEVDGDMLARRVRSPQQSHVSNSTASRLPGDAAVTKIAAAVADASDSSSP